MHHRGNVPLGNPLEVPFGENRLGSNAIHPNAVRAGLRCDILGHEFDPSLGDGVRDRRPGVRTAASSRGDRDDVATSAFFHTRQKALNSKECRCEVSVDGRTPSFFARVFQWAGGSKAPSRVRDKDVYWSELTLDPKTSGLDIGKARDIATDLHRTAAGQLDFSSDGRQCGAISPVDHQLGPVLRIQFSDCGSYPPCTPGPQRHLIS